MLSPADDSYLKGLLDSLDERELGNLKQQLQKRVEELNEDQLSKLLEARQQLAQRASSIASRLAGVRPALRSLDEHLAEIESAAQRAQTAETTRVALEGLEAVFRVVGSLPEIELALLQVVVKNDTSPVSSPRSQEGQRTMDDAASAQAPAKEMPNAANESETAKPAPQPESASSDRIGPTLNVFDTALDRLRRSTRSPGMTNRT